MFMKLGKRLGVVNLMHTSWVEPLLRPLAAFGPEGSSLVGFREVTGVLRKISNAEVHSRQPHAYQLYRLLDFRLILLARL